MAILPITTIGNPILRQVARDLTPEEIQSTRIRRLVEDMIETMHDADGIGIAAPQVSESLQLAVIQIEPESERYPDMEDFALSVFINPKIRILDRTEQGYWEGCLSVPNFRGEVWRPRHVRVDYLDLSGEKRSLDAEGFLATVVQHELDHLQGVLFLDRIRDMRKLATIDDYQRYWLNKPGELHMPD